MAEPKLVRFKIKVVSLDLSIPFFYDLLCSNGFGRSYEETLDSAFYRF